MILETNHTRVVANFLCEVFLRNKKLLIIGNGGSAAEAQHMASELVCGMDRNKGRGFRAMALTTDSSIITAWSNDVNFNDVFARQVEVWGDPGDVLVILSTSGKSKNCLRATKMAIKKHMFVLELPNIGNNTAQIQENHLKEIHKLCRLIQDRLSK